MRIALLKARKAKGLQQKDMARMLRISRSHYTKIESDKRNPSLDLARRIAGIVEKDVNELFFASEGDDASHSRRREESDATA